MSASKHVTIWCDHVPCDGWHDAGEATVTHARDKAKADGWRVNAPDSRRPPGNNQRLDFCPDHRLAPSGEAAEPTDPDYTFGGLFADEQETP
jgi:hypothetical protein